MPDTLVPDTSVLVDGRITDLLEEGQYPKAHILVPMAALSELEAQANRHLETGFAGLDELSKLQHMAHEGKCTVEFVGQRPSSEEIERAARGAIDALIRDTAVESEGLFVTSDRVAAHAANAQGIRHHYIRPIVEDMPDLERLRLTSFFDETTMSVHLKADCHPMAKRGKPGAFRYEEIGNKAIPHQELRSMIKECIEFAKRDYNSFVELERHGCTVLQIGAMRVTIAQPPFSDGLEITAVRPITKTTLDDYDLPDAVLERLEGKSRGVFVSGPPGSGKSTFATAVAEHLHGLGRVVKTMEQPRDLQLPKEVTQYGALDRDMQWTGEVMLLVRPDSVLYDEVRTTNDFNIFADMRLAGIGLFGVTHANRPIDAVQRLLGRVDLGMIPQIVDTIIFIDAGTITDLYELRFTVKVPEGMMVEDLARPVVVVRDVLNEQDMYELYTFGEQIVVMPIAEAQAGRGASSGASALAEKELVRSLRRYVRGDLEVEVRGNKATVYVEQSEVPALIGKGGRTVQGMERKFGVHLDIRSLSERPATSRGGPPAGRDRDTGGPRGGAGEKGRGGPESHGGKGGRGGAGQPKIRQTGSNIFLLVDPSLSGHTLRVEAEGAVIGEATASKEGKLRFKAASAEGKAISAARKAGLDITVKRA